MCGVFHYVMSLFEWLIGILVRIVFSLLAVNSVRVTKQVRDTLFYVNESG